MLGLVFLKPVFYESLSETSSWFGDHGLDKYKTSIVGSWKKHLIDSWCFVYIILYGLHDNECKIDWSKLDHGEGSRECKWMSQTIGNLPKTNSLQFTVQ